MQVLSELCQALDTSYSMLVRSMVCDFLTKNEEVLERIIVNKLYGNGELEEDIEDNLFSK